MFGCECFCWDTSSQLYPEEPQKFSLPSPIPQWPQGQGFGTGRIHLGELEVAKITKFVSIGYCKSLFGTTKGVTFYKPDEIPNGFFSLGHYCHPNDQPLNGYVLVAKDVAEHKSLQKPFNYTLIWTLNSKHEESVYIWLPIAPPGYKAMGFIVTNKQNKPELEEVRCVRDDLTANCETSDTLLNLYAFRVWNTRPCDRGMFGKGVAVGTFYCGTEDEPNIACLKNLDSTLHAMPNLNQINALINHYGPTVFFHPDEAYMPSSVSWFFENGALLCRDDSFNGKPIDSNGLILPAGGENDGKFWVDLPNDDNNNNKRSLKNGDIDSAEFYVHVKPALGGTFTDIVIWVFCPFNGPSTLKAGVVNIEMKRIGQHVGDWEHFTLRLSNFTGELWSIYFSQHSGGEWVNSFDLEYIDGNKPIVYSSKCGHASFPHPGCYVEGSSKLGIGVRNDAARSKFFVDSSVKYEIIAAEYLGDSVVAEPHWLQYMREWGPTVVYDSRSEVEKIINHLPFFVRFSLESFFELFPTALYGEEGPTGPKEKDNWFGDERC